MMRVLVSEFRQESNSFSPIQSTLDFWRQGGVYEPDEVRDALAGTPTAVGGIIRGLQESPHRPDVVYGPVMYCQSGGPAKQEVMDYYLARLVPALEANMPLDGVFLSFHGALQTTEFDDAEGEVVRRVRKVVGGECVIAASTDLHGYISRDIVDRVDVICGYQTYPHVDYFETGYRAARLGLEAIAGATQLVMAWAPVPMIISASAYNTLTGPFRDLEQSAKDLVASGELLDFTIYQMQPWLDIPEAHSTVLTIARDEETAGRHARTLARRLYGLRHEFTTDLHSIDQVIDLAEDPTTPKPVILVDSADSCNAGAPGDSMAVAARLLERGSAIRAATVVNDPAAAAAAHKLGVGRKAKFEVGGAHDPNAVPVQAEGYVRSLHDGAFVQEGPAGRGMVNHIGKTAVLRFGSLDAVVCEWMAGNGDPQLYRAFGVEPTLYDLVVVKANTSFRAAYTAFAGQICETDTPGAAAPDLARLNFERIPRSIFPWTDADEVSIPVVISHRNGAAVRRGGRSC